MKNIKISTKIIITMFISIFGMSIMAIYTYIGVGKIGKELVEIAEYQMPMNKAIVELEKDILKEEILTFELFIESKNPKSKKFKTLVKKIHDLEQKTIDEIIHAEKLVAKAIEHTKTDKSKEQYQSFYDALKILEDEQKHFMKDFETSLNYIKNGNIKKFDEDREKLVTELKLMDKHITQLLNELTQLLQDSTLKAEEDEKSVLLTIEIISAIVIIISIISAFILIRFFNNSIETFQEGLSGFFKFLNNETSEITPLKEENNDEIGNMSKVINNYIEKAKASIEEDKEFINDVKGVVQEINKGHLTSKLHTKTTNENLNELKSNINEMISTLEANIGKDINIILDVLENLSKYDFEKSIDSASGKVEISLNKVIKLINEMLSDNKSTGLTLDSSAKELLVNVNKLNISSNEAAASLEQTAAAVEEITSTVQVTSLKVSEMSELANHVTNSAKNGEDLAGKTTNSMDEINNQVTAINEAITVIDQIAFQTNILSLNAAVEAATAGEAGKGFAVVAAEVRNLASRSSEAAKEIKDLVERANLRADEGKKISNEMSEGYSELNENIQKTIELIKDVTSASREQQAGIEQINDAINLLDRQTQENANVASLTQDISNETSNIAKEILEEVDKKNFIGKNSISAKNVNQNSYVHEEISVPLKKEKKIEEVSVQTSSKTITANNNDDLEWESF